MTRKDLQLINPEALVCDGYDAAIMGYAERAGFGPVVAYSVTKILDILMSSSDMDLDEAMEFYEYNILGSYMGEFTPIFITTEI